MRRIGLLAAIIAIGTSGTASAATIEVDSATDDGTGCTLREAVASADGNADSGGCTGAGTYGDDTITFAPAVVTAGEIPLASELSIDPTTEGTLVIEGPGAASLALSGEDANRVLRITANAGSAANAVTVSGLMIRDGLVDLDDSPRFGAGVLNNGELTLDRTLIEQNAVNVVDTDPDAGGAVLSAGGGGIADFGALRLIRSTVSANTVTVVASSSFQAEAHARGAGITHQSFGDMSLEQSTVSGNTVIAAAATHPDRIAEAYGGGLFFEGGTGEIVGSTIAGNVATGSSPPPGLVIARGGGITVRADISTELNLRGSTIAGNVASGAANIRRLGGTVALQNTVVANASSTNCEGGVASGGHNLADDNSCAFAGTGDINNTPANLEPLADNGGPTMTRRPAPPTAGTPSPLIDAGAADQPTDQRGLARTVEYDLANGNGGDGTDIGAVEVQGATPTATTPASPNADANPEVTGTAEPGSTVHLFSGSACATEVGTGTAAAFAGPGFTVGPLALGSTTGFRATAEYGTATSLCSPTGVSYTRPAPPDTGSPGPGVTPTPPPAEAPKKCKKGQKLKKGKCVKKKRKRKK